MKIQRMFLTPNKYSRAQIPLKKVTKIAVHYVGNAGSTAQGNRNYFESLKEGKRDKNGNLIYASSHYIVGLDGEVIQCIPESEISYATNEANYYSISIENCHAKADGKFNEKTLKSLRELCAELCKRYGLDPINDIIRHYDVTGKACPLWWVNKPQEFLYFKQDVEKTMKGEYVDMEELKKLKKEVAELRKEINDSREKVYNRIEDVPEWGKCVVYDLADRGVLKGTNRGLDISETLLRMLVINYRAGVYGDGSTPR